MNAPCGVTNFPDIRELLSKWDLRDCRDLIEPWIDNEGSIG